MPPQLIKPEATNPNRKLPEVDTSAFDRRPSRFSRLLGRRGLENDSRIAPVENMHNLNMNIAESYGVSWGIEKCARDALQNFFDANGGTLDGVDINLEVRQGEDKGRESTGEDPVYLHDVIIRGNGSYDYRDLTVLGATTKKTGELTAGGFGEGAKVLSLVLLKEEEFGVDRVVYRSRDWQLEFFLGDLPDSTVARPTRGLFARVVTGLEQVEGSEMMISCRKESTAQQIVDAKQLFRSSENPDFNDVTIEKVLDDGSQIGVKFLGTSGDRHAELNKGNLYIAGQRREYNRYGSDEGWETVRGLSIYTTKDVNPGDRDRGGISNRTLKEEIIEPIASQMTADEIEKLIRSVDPNFSSNLLAISELGTLLDAVAKRGGELDLKIGFDEKFVACNPFLSFDLKRMLESKGLVLCPYSFSHLGMKTSNEVIKEWHEHQRIEPSPEHINKITILNQALDLLKDVSQEKEFANRDIALYSQSDENNPAHGTNSDEFVWIAVEHMDKGFAQVFATYLHELDHKYGSDQSAEFSYALTDTLSAVLEAVSADSNIAARWQDLSRQWNEIKNMVGASK